APASRPVSSATVTTRRAVPAGCPVGGAVGGSSGGGAASARLTITVCADGSRQGSLLPSDHHSCVDGSRPVPPATARSPPTRVIPRMTRRVLPSGRHPRLRSAHPPVRSLLEESSPPLPPPPTRRSSRSCCTR